MTEQQIPKLVAGLVEHQRHFSALPTTHMQWAIQHTAEAIALFTTAVQNRAVEPKEFFKFVTTVAVPGHERFVVADHYKENMSRKAEVKIGCMHKRFKTIFLPTIETHVRARELEVREFLETSLGFPIRILGEPHRFAITLADLWTMLKAQPNGEQGALDTSGCGNTFFAYDGPQYEGGDLWMAHANWDSCSGGWVFGVPSPTDVDSLELQGHRLILSR